MRLVVKPHRPVRKLLGLTFAVVALALIVWLSVDYDQWRFIKERMSVTARRQLLWRDNNELQSENLKMRQQLIGLQRDHKVDQQSYLEVSETLGDLQAKIRSLKDEVSFYRGIMSSAGNDSGLRLQGLRFQRIVDTRRYHYTLVLTHLGKSELPAEGQLLIRLDGRQQGQLRQLELAALERDGHTEFSFRFKHFRLIEGIIELPQDFKPEIVHAELIPNSKASNKLVQTFDWVAVNN